MCIDKIQIQMLIKRLIISPFEAVWLLMQRVWSQIGFNGLNHHLLSDSAQLHISCPSLFTADRLPRKNSICPVVCPHHMPHPWSFKVLHLIWHFQSVMKWPEWALAQSQMHLACCILSYPSQFIVMTNYCTSDCLSTLQSKPIVLCKVALIMKFCFHANYFI